MNNVEEPILVLREEVNSTLQDYPDLTAYYDALGHDLKSRYLKNRTMADLDASIQFLEKAANETPPGHPDLAVRLEHLGGGLLTRYSETGVMEHLFEAIEVMQNVVDKTPEDHPDFAIRLHRLTDGIWERYVMTNAFEDLMETIELMENVIEKTPENDPDLALRFHDLGDCMWDKYLKTDAAEDLERSIQLGLKTIQHTPENAPYKGRILRRLGARYKARYVKFERRIDLEEAIQFEEQAIDASTKDCEILWEILYQLGNSYYFRFLKTKEVADLERASHFTQSTLDKIPPGEYTNRAPFLSTLGTDLWKRYKDTNAMTDLEQAIQFGQKSIELTPETDPNKSQRLYNLAIHLMGKFSLTNTIIDLNDSLRTIEEAINLAAHDKPERITWLYYYAIFLQHKIEKSGAIEDFERFIQIMQEALDGVPENNPQCWAIWANYLGAFHLKRYVKTGSMPDVEEAIQLIRRANQEIPKDHPERITISQNLGNCFFEKYSKTNDVADLDTAIQIEQETASITPKDHPGRIGLFRNFANSLIERFLNTDATVDLEEAIRVGKEATDGVTKDKIPKDMIQSRQQLLGDLGTFFQHRYVRTEKMADLEQAIHLEQEAIEGTLEDDHNRSKWLTNLSVCFRNKYQRTKAMADLEEAIRVGQIAVNESRENHPTWVEQLKNLGVCFQMKYRRTRALPDLEKAIAVGQEAIDIISETQPDRAGLSHHLAVCFQTKYLRTKAPSDLGEAVRYYQSALYQENAPGITRIAAGNAVLTLHVETSNWQHAYEDSCFALRLIPTLISRSLANADKQYLLGLAAGLTCDATAAALQAGETPLEAIRLLEQGRGALAASILDLRIDIFHLKTKHRDLADEFVRLRDELKIPIVQSDSLGEESFGLLSQQRASRRYNAGRELDRLVDEIRKSADFEDFLLPPSDENIRGAADNGPIVMVNVSEYRCDALLIEQHQARSLALPQVNRKKIEEMAQRYDLGSYRVLEWLWDVIADPILDALGFTQSPCGNEWPHVWWIPMGSLSRFPLHAAGYHRKGSDRTVLDRVMSSYSPSIRAIIHGRSRRIPESTPAALVAHKKPQALLVAMQDTPKHNRLPSAVSEIELIRQCCKLMALNPVEPGSFKSDILYQLRNCKIFHFAGHGKTDNLDPSQSYLLLRDWETNPLTVASIIDENIHEHTPFLAYLSACGTGQIRVEKYFDESIHLISACQLAGFRHVIGTLWSVEDDVCQDIARFTYEEIAKGMQKGYMTDESVCRGLHKATRSLRDRWLDNLAATNRPHRFFKRPWGDRPQGNSSARESLQGDDRSQRPAQEVISDDEDDTTISPSLVPSNWVPYVHFGV